MKITDVTLTLFAWDDIPATRYAAHTGRFGGGSHVGLLTVKTDEGIDGHAFLGSSYHSAAHDGPGTLVEPPLGLASSPRWYPVRA